MANYLLFSLKNPAFQIQHPPLLFFSVYIWTEIHTDEEKSPVINSIVELKSNPVATHWHPWVCIKPTWDNSIHFFYREGFKPGIVSQRRGDQCWRKSFDRWSCGRPTLWLVIAAVTGYRTLWDGAAGSNRGTAHSSANRDAATSRGCLSTLPVLSCSRRSSAGFSRPSLWPGSVDRRTQQPHFGTAAVAQQPKARRQNTRILAHHFLALHTEGSSSSVQ